MALRLSALCFVCVAWLGCSAPPPDMTPDAATPVDSGVADAGPTFGGWTLLDGGPTIMGKQDDVYFIDENNGWSVNGLGRIYKTTDTGKTWTKVLDQPGTYFRAVVFFDPMRGFASNIGTDYYPGVTDTVPLYLTTNGGMTWSPVTTFNGPTPKGICNFSRIDDQHVIATGRVGGPSFFLSSDDQGATWNSTDLSPQDAGTSMDGGAPPDGGTSATIAMLVDSHFSTPLEGVITGGSALDASSQCLILRTEDGGKTWAEVFRSTEKNRMCWKVSFPSDTIGYASVLTFGGGPATIIKTFDGGKTWVEFGVLPTSYAGLGVGFITENIGWLGGEAAGKPVYRTDDGAATWTADTTLGPYINRFRFIGTKAGYAIGSSIYKLEVH